VTKLAKVRLGEVARECKSTVEDSTGLPIVGLEHLIPGQIELTQWSEKTNNTFTKGFKKGQILFGRRRAYQKKAAVAPFDGICSGDITVIEALPDRILPELLPFIIQNDSLFDYAVEKSAGSLSPRVKWEHLKNYEFELPELESQQKLVDLLWAMTRTKKAYQTLIKKTDELVKSQFMEMFGDPVDNPMGWQKLQLQQLVSEDCSISYGIVKTGDDVEDGIPVFRPVDIVGKVPTRAELKRTTPEISNQYKRSLLKGRDLLVTVRANIADTFIAGEEFKGCNVGRGIVPIRTDESKIRLEFLKAQMDFDSMNSYMKTLAKGITLIQLNMEDLRCVEFIVPPTAEQDRYIGILQQSDKSKFEAQQALNYLTAAQKALIRQHLTK